MKFVKSFDIFDTIIGRTINTQSDFFKKCMLLNNLTDFINIRIQSEEKAKVENNFYTLMNIYKYIQLHYKLSYTKTIQYMNLEFDTEYSNIYPIYTNINKITSDYILISETYYSSEQLKKLLSKYNIIDIPIYTSNELLASKLDGTIYTHLKKIYKITLHTGSNYIQDYQMPHSLKINSVHFDYKYNPIILKLQNKVSSYTIDYFRMIECSCSKTEYEHIWNTQLYYNIPLLLLFTNIIHQFCIDKGIQEVIFINRNCILIKQIFDIVNRVKPINITITELTISIKLLQNKKYLQKIIKQFNKTTKYLIVDINNGIKRIIANIFKASYNIEPYFYFIFSDVNTSDIYTYSLFSENIELSKIIELLNLPEIGLPNDYVNNIIKYDPIDYDINIPLIYYEVIEIIDNMPDLLFINDLHQNFLADFLINLNELKTNIITNSEYKLLHDIYIKNTTNFLKLDYILASPVPVNTNTGKGTNIDNVNTGVNTDLNTDVKLSTPKISSSSSRGIIKSSSIKLMHKYRQHNARSHQNTTSEVDVKLNNTTLDINNGVTNTVNESHTNESTKKCINGIELFESKKDEIKKNVDDDTNKSESEPNLNKRIINLRRQSAKNKK